MDLILILKYLKANSTRISDRCNTMTIKAIKSKNNDETIKLKVRIRLKRQSKAPDMHKSALIKMQQEME
jgi:hypothetical protein